MSNSSSQRSGNIIGSLFALAAISYAVWTVTTSVNKNVATNKRISGLETEIAQLKSENAELENLIYYYQTDSFKEIEARRRLGLKAKDEQVIILPKRTINPADDQSENRTETKTDVESEETNVSKWWQFLFDDV